jgi:hypothetical protein
VCDPRPTPLIIVISHFDLKKKTLPRSFVAVHIHIQPPPKSKMVLAKSKNTVGLGNSLRNDQFGRKKNRNGIERVSATGERVSNPCDIQIMPLLTRVST